MAKFGEILHVSEAFLKRKSGEFDIESIFFLNLSAYGIENLGCIGQCIALENLNLSGNSISQLQPLSGLCNLSHLDLSSNRISNLDGLQTLTSLTCLNIAGNLIPSFDTLKVLSGLEKLMELRMKDDSHRHTNPICHCVDYKSQLHKILPDITILDGERVNGPGSELFRIYAEMDKTVEGLKSFCENRISSDTKPGSWLSQEDLKFNDDDLAKSSTDFDAHNELVESSAKGLLNDCLQLLKTFDNQLIRMHCELEPT